MTNKDIPTQLRALAETKRKSYEYGGFRKCDCSTIDGALEYGRAQGLEMAADMIEAAKVALDVRVDDLVSLLGRFVHKTRDMAEMADLRTKTLGYLSRKGLTPSPLRGVE